VEAAEHKTSQLRAMSGSTTMITRSMYAFLSDLSVLCVICMNDVPGRVAGGDVDPLDDDDDTWHVSWELGRA
jgi:hypothetical protein